MKALVLCGGIPQIALMEYLKSRNITVLLADMNEKVVGRKYADAFFSVSVLDVDGIEQLAKSEKVDFIITVCADQVLQVVAEVSERLGLPCYIDFETAQNVSKKSFMKKIFHDNGIPTSKYVIIDEFSTNAVSELRFPLIVKPIDSYSSRGVKKCTTVKELEDAFIAAKNISRSKRVIVEEFVAGDEITVDVYVENGEAKLLCASNIDKIGADDKFVIHRTRFPAQITQDVYRKIEKVSQQIADAFGLKNSPMLIQLITDGKDISIVEFCARTGGGDKFRLIEKVSGFNVVNAVADLTLGELPHCVQTNKKQQYILNEFLYCNEGVLDHLEGFSELLEEGIITEYYQLKTAGAEFGEIKSSGDRVAYFTIETDNAEDMYEKLTFANQKIKAVSVDGEDLLRHDLLSKN